MSTGLPLRNIGPFRSGAWVTSVAVPKSPAHDHLYTIWVGQRSGGVWKSGDLPAAPINVVVQDRKNASLLFVGNDLGLFASLDGGVHWSRFTNGFPTVAVHDLLVAKREQDIVSPLQELSDTMAGEELHLFDIKPKARYGSGTQGMRYELYGTNTCACPTSRKRSRSIITSPTRRPVVRESR